MPSVVFTFKKPSAQTPSLSGTKGATLAKMTRAGLPVPPGFIISTKAFQSLNRKISIQQKMPKKSDLNALQKRSGEIQKIIYDHEFSKDITTQITKAYNALGKTSVSVRSSSTAEDLADASFAGQYDSFLNVCSQEELIQSIKKVWASLYSPHAIEYRQKNKIPNNKAKMAVVVQQ